MADSSTTEIPTAALIVIGNEILSGRTQDANIQFLATALGRIGIPLVEVRVVPDVEDNIVDAINTLRTKTNYVFTTGGIGPTHDDITAASVAKAFGVELVRHEPSVEKMERYYGDKLNKARLKMADIPDGADPIETRVTSAPGFRKENVFVMAGVPTIARAMFDSVEADLAHGPPVLSRYVEAYMGEGDLADTLTAIQSEFPDVDIGSYPFFRKGKIALTVVTKGTDGDRIDQAIDKVTKSIDEMGKSFRVDQVLEE